jgi:hypothetical protein
MIVNSAASAVYLLYQSYPCSGQMSIRHHLIKSPQASFRKKVSGAFLFGCCGLAMGRNSSSVAQICNTAVVWSGNPYCLHTLAEALNFLMRGCSRRSFVHLNPIDAMMGSGVAVSLSRAVCVRRWSDRASRICTSRIEYKGVAMLPLQLFTRLASPSRFLLSLSFPPSPFHSFLA